MQQFTVYGAVRKPANESREFALASEMSSHADMVHKLIAESEMNVAGWHRANPVQRIAKFTVTEWE